jgi:hypothetical protein
LEVVGSDLSASAHSFRIGPEVRLHRNLFERSHIWSESVSDCLAMPLFVTFFENKPS